MTIYKKQEVDDDVCTLALRRLRTCFDRYDRCFVSFSGGKDSTVCLDLSLQVARELGKLPLDVFFYDEEAIPPETVDYVARVAAIPDVRLHWLCLPIQHRNACSERSPIWHPWSPEHRELWCRELPEQAIVKLPRFKRQAMPESNGFIAGPQLGRVCVIQGIRTQESLNRYMAVAGGKKGDEAFLSKDASWKHITKAYPIYDWTTQDVWIAPAAFGWDYNRAYDLMQAAGVPLHLQRCAPPYGEQPIQRLWTYKVCWPDLWDKMAVRVPGAATAARYSRTELYGFGDLSGLKPIEMSWREFTYARMLRYEGEVKKTCARWIKYLIELHRKNAGDRPIPDDEPDADSGLSWKEISRVAITGDQKGRKAPAIAAKVNGQVRKKRAKKASEANG
jgi:predicted phosphoadenosine phosphosulfate sulfurtransferase